MFYLLSQLKKLKFCLSFQLHIASSLRFRCIFDYFLVGGWTTHVKNMLVKLDHFPNFRDENKKNVKPPPSYMVFKVFFMILLQKMFQCVFSIHLSLSDSSASPKLLFNSAKSASAPELLEDFPSRSWPPGPLLVVEGKGGNFHMGML